MRAATTTYLRAFSLGGNLFEMRVVLDDNGGLCGIAFDAPEHPLRAGLEPGLRHLATAYLKAVLEGAAIGRTPHDLAEDYPDDGKGGREIMRAIGDLQLDVIGLRLKSIQGVRH